MVPDQFLEWLAWGVCASVSPALGKGWDPPPWVHPRGVQPPPQSLQAAITHLHRGRVPQEHASPAIISPLHLSRLLNCTPTPPRL